MIDAASRGNVEAWEQLVQAYQQPIFRLAYLLLGDADDAEDVAQETFIRAYQALGRFDSARPLRPWLMRIAKNLCHNWRRTAGRYLAALQSSWRNELVGRGELAGHGDLAGQATVQQAEQHLEAQTLWTAVRRLRPEDQQVIYLRYFLECSEIETAQVLSIAQGTVKSRQHRALARLRIVLQNEGGPLVQEGTDAG